MDFLPSDIIEYCTFRKSLYKDLSTFSQENVCMSGCHNDCQFCDDIKKLRKDLFGDRMLKVEELYAEINNRYTNKQAIGYLINTYGEYLKLLDIEIDLVKQKKLFNFLEKEDIDEYPEITNLKYQVNLTIETYNKSLLGKEDLIKDMKYLVKNLKNKTT